MAYRSAANPEGDWLQVPLLKLDVTPMTTGDVVDWVTKPNLKSLILNHNLHSAYLHETDRTFREAYANADRVLIDGAPILQLSRLASSEPLTPEHRVGSTDWLAKLHDAPRDGRLFIFGASREANRCAVDEMRKQLSGTDWEVAGTDGYRNWESALHEIRRFRPTLVIVGLGMPLQEDFLSTHWEELPRAHYATVGGAIDYIAGTEKLCPRWVGRFGLEWMWRLGHDPRRLAHRYLVEPFKLAAALCRR